MKKLVLLSIFVAFVVIILGAHARLTDAGLGCPDWPGCYGHLTVGQAIENIEQSQQAFPERPLVEHKAWNEMIHRYFASGLGLLILIIFVLSLFNRAYNKPIKLPFFLLCLVGFQGALGMWTVTMNLLPIVVMGHLLGGFAVLSCLFILYLRMTTYRIPGGDHRVRRFAGYAAIGIVVLIAQIALGGWTSTNYAALACTEFPVCENDWYRNLDFIGAYTIPPADNYEFGAHDYAQRMTMHITHRFGALFTFIYLCWLAIRLYSNAASSMIRGLSIVLVLVLGVQVALGVANVAFSLPLVNAVLHNAVAACLLLVMVLITYTLYRKT
jgi:heme a synthase